MSDLYSPDSSFQLDASPQRSQFFDHLRIRVPLAWLPDSESHIPGVQRVGPDVFTLCLAVNSAVLFVDFVAPMYRASLLSVVTVSTSTYVSAYFGVSGSPG